MKPTKEVLIRYVENMLYALSLPGEPSRESIEHDLMVLLEMIKKL